MLKFNMYSTSSSSFVSKEKQNNTCGCAPDPAIRLCKKQTCAWWDVPVKGKWDLIITKRPHPEAYKCKYVRDKLHVWDPSRNRWSRYCLYHETDRTIRREFDPREIFYARAEVYN